MMKVADIAILKSGQHSLPVIASSQTGKVPALFHIGAATPAFIGGIAVHKELGYGHGPATERALLWPNPSNRMS